jgi:hypothetical protein
MKHVAMHYVRPEALDQTAKPEDCARIGKPSSYAQPMDTDSLTLDLVNVSVWFGEANNSDLPPACLQLSSQARHLRLSSTKGQVGHEHENPARSGTF